MLSFNDNNAQYLIVNSELTGSDTLKKNESGAIVLPFEGPVIYEVIRFINGKGLFLEDHFRRLENSFQIEGIENAYVVKDDIEYGYKNIIPLWAFGLTY